MEGGDGLQSVGIATYLGDSKYPGKLVPHGIFVRMVDLFTWYRRKWLAFPPVQHQNRLNGVAKATGRTRRTPSLGNWLYSQTEGLKPISALRFGGRAVQCYVSVTEIPFKGPRYWWLVNGEWFLPQIDSEEYR